jgi:hypothetical protein
MFGAMVRDCKLALCFSVMPPERFHNAASARERFGARIDLLAGALERTDTLADRVVVELDNTHPARGRSILDTALSHGIEAVASAPPALRELFSEIEHVPDWVDWSRVDRGGDIVFRSGLGGVLVLGTSSLAQGYASPAGNKPLVFSGRLRDQAYRRLHETAKFLVAICRRGGMRRHAEGFHITVRVRLIHARIRKMILSSGRWHPERWGAPANQHDMAGTHLMFSLVLLQGLRDLGFRVSREESDGYMHLWRYVSHVMGIDPALVPHDESQAYTLAEMIRATELPPDDDSRALVRALLDAPHTAPRDAMFGGWSAVPMAALGEGVCRGLIGDPLADALGVARTPWRHAVPILRKVVGPIESLRALPAVARTTRAAGEWWWNQLVERGLGGVPAEFPLPERLGNVAALHR